MTIREALRSISRSGIPLSPEGSLFSERENAMLANEPILHLFLPMSGNIWLIAGLFLPFFFSSFVMLQARIA